MEETLHRYGEDGYCEWCGQHRRTARTRNCPMCPYDDGKAYLDEVDEP